MDHTRDNVIVLTPGLCGSSVVTGLLQQIGYWAGHNTVKKRDYDTFENSNLVALNERLLAEVGYSGRADQDFHPQTAKLVAERFDAVDPAPYRAFIDECTAQGPFVWKDPRFWLTIDFWLRHLDRDRLRVILVTRQKRQAWISHVLRRKIQTPRYCDAHMSGVHQANLDHAERYRLPSLVLVYEDFLCAPEANLARLNEFLGSNLTMQALHRVFHGTLYKRPHGVIDSLHALLVYMANFSSRAKFVSY